MSKGGRIFNFFFNLEKKYWAKSLTARGVYYEDTLFEDEAVVLAVGRLPADVRKDRERRRMRAVEVDVKNYTLPDELRNYDPFASYGLASLVREVEQEMGERTNYL